MKDGGQLTAVFLLIDSTYRKHIQESSSVCVCECVLEAERDRNRGGKVQFMWESSHKLPPAEKRMSSGENRAHDCTIVLVHMYTLCVCMHVLWK